MPVTSGYGLTNLSDTVSLNLAKSQSRLQSDVSRLSSGLRITSAADDPSGLAIAEGLQSKVNGYDQAASNLQDATNALTVADGALQTVTDILHRLRSLAVEANDDLIAASDRADLQTEVNQLKHEIDSISQNTYFNGLSLLNGTASYVAAGPPVTEPTFANPYVGLASNPGSYEYQPVGSAWTFSTAGPTGGSGITGYGAGNNFTNYTYANTPATPSGSTQVGFVQGTGEMSQEISGFSSGQSYAVIFNVAQRGEDLYANVAPESFDVLVDGKSIGTYQPVPANLAEPGWGSITTPDFSPTTGAHTISFEGNDPTGTNTVFIDNVNIVAITEGKTLDVHGGADEGDAIGCVVPTANTSYLGISLSSVMSTASAASSEAAIDGALQTVGTGRAMLGAQMVRLQEQATNDNTASVNLTGSESNIRDLNVSEATTAFAAEQILSSIGTSILGNVKTLAASVERLFQ